MSVADLLMAIIALLLCVVCRTLRGIRRDLAHGARVHVPELGEVAYSLGAMRTHLYQIGRALRHKRNATGSLDGDAFFEYAEAVKKTE
jgi:hypothetical protein